MNSNPRQPEDLPPLGGHGLYGEDGSPPETGAQTEQRPLAASQPVRPEDWITQTLPASPDRPLPPRTLPKLPPGGPRTGGRLPGWMIALSAVTAVVLVATTVFYVTRALPHGTSSVKPGCEDGTPCAVVDAYLLAYTAGDYEKMYSFTSTASRTRFSDPAVLRGTYKDAHDYIVSRPGFILAEARVSEVAATPGKTTTASASKASTAVHVTMKSARIGQITQDITIPLVKENGQWRVEWSPGLIFSNLDDPADPQYRRRVVMIDADAARGTIFDRDGNVLAQDGTAYAIQVTPSLVRDQNALLTTLSAKLDLTPDEIKARLADGAQNQPHTVRVITLDLYKNVSDAIGGVSGVTVTQVTRRIYPYGADTAAVTGYMNEVSQQELGADKTDYYESGDHVGRQGVEQWGEQYLRPTKGGKLTIYNVDAQNNNTDIAYTIAQRDPSRGADIHTAISLRHQRVTMAALAAKNGKGAGVMAVDPVTGDVLVMASSPIFDPNDFTLGFTKNELDRFNALDHPYLNRVLSGSLPIGSVMKLTTLGAALENGVKPTDLFTCHGTYTVPGETQTRSDNNGVQHGTITAPQAIPPSCDVIFWQIGVLLNDKDPNIMPKMAKAWGYGAKTNITGISPDEEVPGTVPDPQWLRDTKNAGWSPTDAANLATGQGFFEATPAQVAMVAAAIGNGGKRMQPRLVTSVVSSTGTTLASYPVNQVGTLPLSPDNLAIIQQSMVLAVDAANGTSTQVFKDLNLRFGGKTGTAESGQALPHAWFACFAPASPLSGPPVTPTLAMAVNVQYVGFGAVDAAPISKQLLKAYFNL